MNKTHWIILAIIIILLAIWGLTRDSGPETQDEPIRIGALLPIIGPVASVWGEPMQKGIALAESQLNNEKEVVKVLIEDVQTDPKLGIAGYNKFVDIDDVDAVVSIFSRVSVPLVSLADEDEIPLVMTLVSAENIADESPYVFRFWPLPEQYVTPHFNTVINSDKYSKIGVLYVNDEYGVSVRNVIRREADKKGIVIVSEEGFIPNSSDFRTQLTKMKAKSPQALLFVGAIPPEIFGALNQSLELQLDVDFFEESILLSVDSLRRAAGEAANQAFTNAFPFTLEQSGNDFRNKYIEEYGEEPPFIAGIAYDIVRLIVESADGKNLDGKELARQMRNLGTFRSINGDITVKQNGEINPDLNVVQIVDGNLVRIK